ncbi:unnamed protein product, partial [Phaeothamnion confervicola]
SETRLFGPDAGWSLEPVAAWLLTEGRKIPDAVGLVTELAAQLDAAGANVDRIRLTTTTLHAQVLAWGVFWDRGQGARPWSAGHGVQSLDAYIGSPNQYVRDRREPFRRRLDTPSREDDHATLDDLRKEGMADYYALPIVFGSDAVAVFTLATQSPAGFTDADLARFDALANLLGPMLEVIATRRITLGLLDTFVGARISEKILNGQVRRGDGDRIKAAFWYSDLRGF